MISDDDKNQNQIYSKPSYWIIDLLGIETFNSKKKHAIMQ